MPSHKRSEHRGCPLSDPLLFRLDASTVSSGYPEHVPPTPPVSCVAEAETTGGKTVPGVRLGTTVGSKERCRPLGSTSMVVAGMPENSTACPVGDFTRSKTVVSASAMYDGWMTTRGSLLPVRPLRVQSVSTPSGQDVQGWPEITPGLHSTPIAAR